MIIFIRRRSWLTLVLYKTDLYFEWFIEAFNFTTWYTYCFSFEYYFFTCEQNKDREFYKHEKEVGMSSETYVSEYLFI